MSELFKDSSCFDSHNPVWGVLARSYQLLNNVTADGNGAWCDVRALKQFTVHAYGTFAGATVSIYASNDSDPNSSGDSGVLLGTAFGAAGVQPFTGPYRWVRAVVAGGSGEDLDAVLHGVG